MAWAGEGSAAERLCLGSDGVLLIVELALEVLAGVVVMTVGLLDLVPLAVEGLVLGVEVSACNSR